MAQRSDFVELAAIASTAFRGRLGNPAGVQLPIIAPTTKFPWCCRGLTVDGFGSVCPFCFVTFLRCGPQAEKPRPVPAGAGYQDRDFRQVAERLSVIGK